MFRINMRLDGEPLEEVNCSKNLRAQVATSGGCEWDVDHEVQSMNEGSTEVCEYDKNGVDGENTRKAKAR